MKARIKSLAAGYKNPEEIVNWYYNSKEHLAEIESLVLEEQAFARLQEQVEIEEKVISYEEAIHA